MNDDSVILNLTCSNVRGPGRAEKLPERLPDGSKIINNQKLTSKLFRSHTPATKEGRVYIPKHKLPCLDEFGLMNQDKKFDKLLVERQEKKNPSKDKVEAPTAGLAPNFSKRLIKKSGERKSSDESSNLPDKRMIIPDEVKAVAGGLPPSFPKRLLKKYSEPRLLDAGRDQSPERKKRRSFVPGQNPRRKEKSPNLFVNICVENIKGLHPFLISSLQQNYDITQLTKIQSMAIPKLLTLDGTCNEYIINSQIGSGKTLSYIVPVINTLATIEPKISRTDGVHALILLPTREQAAVVNEIFVKLCRSFTWIVPGLLVGGERKKSEKARIRKGLNILITTPGRLIDHIQHTHKLEFSKVKYFILADAHKLLDPERVDAAHEIVGIMRRKLPKSCMKCLVTATITKKIEKLADMIVKKPVTLDAFQD